MALTSNVTAAQVRTLVTTSLSDSDLGALIADAKLTAEGCETCLSAYSQDRIDAIIKYIAAHLVTVRSGNSGVVTQKALGDASTSYAARAVGSDLRSTSFGEQALAFDTSGCLQNLGKSRTRFAAI